VALLRGINLLGHKRVPMAELRALAERLRWRDVATYIASGNLVFGADADAAACALQLERAIERRFGFSASVIVRTAAQWARYTKATAFPDAASTRPSHLLLALAAKAPPKSIVRAVQPHCRAGERVAVRGDALWIDYTNGIARSKLTPAVLDRLVGSPVTARNWRTVQAIGAMTTSG